MFVNGRHPDPGSAARRIIEALARRGPLTIAELVSELGVTTTAVRQQVNRLLAQGWITCVQRRGGPGRPADVLSLSDQARQLFAPYADELARLVVNEVSAMDGPEHALELLRRVTTRIAERSRSAVGAGPIRQRIRRLAGALSEQGMLVESDGGEAGLRLTVYACPYSDLAAEHPQICELERETFSDLIGREVELEHCLLDGQNCCAFHVSELPNSSASGSVRGTGDA